MNKDKTEITTWIKTYTKDLYSYTHSKVTHKESAEDIVQNTFLAAWESYQKFEGRSNPKTWLFSILKNKIADFYRQKYKESSSHISFDPLEICFDKYGAWETCHKPKHWREQGVELLDNP